MGMAVAKAVKKLGFDVSIKWPNDVVVSHKKICGILTEMGVRDGKMCIRDSFKVKNQTSIWKIMVKSRKTECNFGNYLRKES